MKPKSKFSTDQSRHDGLRNRCKDCDSQYWRETYYPAHREKLIKKTINNREKRRVKAAEAAKAEQEAK